jgi:hypothetical protein
MTWQPFVMLVLALLFAGCLIVSILIMLALKCVDAIGRAWRWCRGRP